VFCGNDPVNNSDPSGLDWLDNAANFSAGMADNLTFGLTGKFRKMAGYDCVVDRSGTAYSIGGWTGTGVGLALGGAHAGKNIVAQMGRQGSLLTRVGRGVSRFAWDNRSWGSVRSTWSRAMGGLRSSGSQLHHWLEPQRGLWLRGFKNAGFNYVAISDGFNMWMNGTTGTRIFVEYLFKAGMLTELSPLYRLFQDNDHQASEGK
jgi:hypothetical protein